MVFGFRWYCDQYPDFSHRNFSPCLYHMTSCLHPVTYSDERKSIPTCSDVSYPINIWFCGAPSWLPHYVTPDSDSELWRDKKHFLSFQRKLSDPMAYRFDPQERVTAFWFFEAYPWSCHQIFEDTWSIDHLWSTLLVDCSGADSTKIGPRWTYLGSNQLTCVGKKHKNLLIFSYLLILHANKY